jgi:hypothetical protein
MLGGTWYCDTATPEDEQDATFGPKVWGVRLNEVESEQTQCLLAILHQSTYGSLVAQELRSEGIRGRGAFDALCVKPVCFLSGGRFEFARYLRDAAGNVLAVIIPARDETGELADLAALNLDTGALAMWRGRVAMLGQENILAPRIGEPLLVHETPIDWLRAEREGVFVISSHSAAPLLRMGEPLGVQSARFGQRLRDALTIPAPRIVVATNQRAAA